MRSNHLRCSALLVAMAAVVGGCGDRTATAPTPIGAPQASLIGNLFGLVDSCSSLPSATVSQTIGRQGGVIAIGPDTLRIPPNALSKPVTIRASLPAGYFVNIVLFQPDGLRFHKPTTLTMGYSNCNLLSFLPLEIAVVTDDLQVIEYLQSTDNKRAKTVTGAVQHFTNYALSW